MTGTRSVRTRPRNGLAISDLLTCGAALRTVPSQRGTLDRQRVDHRHPRPRQPAPPVRRGPRVGVARSSLLLTEVLAELGGPRLRTSMSRCGRSTTTTGSCSRLEDRIDARTSPLYSESGPPREDHGRQRLGDEGIDELHLERPPGQTRRASTSVVDQRSRWRTERLELRTRWIGDRMSDSPQTSSSTRFFGPGNGIWPGAWTRAHPMAQHLDAVPGGTGVPGGVPGDAAASAAATAAQRVVRDRLGHGACRARPAAPGGRRRPHLGPVRRPGGTLDPDDPVHAGDPGLPRSGHDLRA